MQVRLLHPSLLPEQDAAVDELSDRFSSEQWTTDHRVRVLCSRCGEVVGHATAYSYRQGSEPARIRGRLVGDVFLGRQGNQQLRDHLAGRRRAGVDTGERGRDPVSWQYTVLLDWLQHDIDDLPVWCSRHGDLVIGASHVNGARLGARDRGLQTIRARRHLA